MITAAVAGTPVALGPQAPNSMLAMTKTPKTSPVRFLLNIYSPPESKLRIGYELCRKRLMASRLHQSYYDWPHLLSKRDGILRSLVWGGAGRPPSPAPFPRGK